MPRGCHVQAAEAVCEGLHTSLPIFEGRYKQSKVRLACWKKKSMLSFLLKTTPKRLVKFYSTSRKPAKPMSLKKRRQPTTARPREADALRTSRDELPASYSSAATAAMPSPPTGCTCRFQHPFEPQHRAKKIFVQSLKKKKNNKTCLLDLPLFVSFETLAKKQPQNVEPPNISGLNKKLTSFSTKEEKPELEPYFREKHGATGLPSTHPPLPAGFRKSRRPPGVGWDRCKPAWAPLSALRTSSSGSAMLGPKTVQFFVRNLLRNARHARVLCVRVDPRFCNQS